MNKDNPVARILFVDDEVRILNSMKFLFRRGYDVTTTDSAAHAVELLGSEHFDVVVSDQRMPEMTGVEMLAKARAVSPATMRILLTGYSDLNAIEASINEGEVFRFVTKPWDNADLRSTVDLAIAASRESSAELAAARTGAPLAEAGADTEVDSETAALGLPQVLVLDDDVELRDSLRDGLQARFKTHTVDTLEAAVDVLEQADICVVVTATELGGEDVTSIVSALKQARPEVVTVTLSARPDAMQLINLVNYGQVYRFLRKPAPIEDIVSAVSGAARRYVALVNNPALSARYSVRPVTETEATAPAPQPASGPPTGLEQTSATEQAPATAGPPPVTRKSLGLGARLARLGSRLGFGRRAGTEPEAA